MSAGFWRNGGGSMPEWRKTTLGEVLTLQRGFDLPQRIRKPGPYPVVSSSGVTGSHDDAKVQPPGVVVGRYGSLGSVHWVTTPFWPLNTALWVRDFKGADERYVSYLLQTVTYDGSTASAVPGVNRNHLHGLPVRIPEDPSTQRRIAAVLSAFDELIEINERRIELLEDLARSLYREWFVRFRFPGHPDVEMVDSELGPIPDGWEIRRLCELAEVNPRKLKKGELPDPLLYLDISAVGVGKIGEPAGLSAGDAPGRARHVAADGDTLWATVRPNRRSHGLLHDPPSNLVVSTGLAVLSPRGVPSSYLYMHAADIAFAEFLVSRASGSAYPAVRPPDFEESRMVLPPSPILEEFADRAEPLLRLATQLRCESSALAATRDLLLPRLVTGRLDISDLDLGILEPAEEG